MCNSCANLLIIYRLHDDKKTIISRQCILQFCVDLLKKNLIMLRDIVIHPIYYRPQYCVLALIKFGMHNNQLYSHANFGLDDFSTAMG